MEGYSTGEAAKKLGISRRTMARYIASGAPVPPVQKIGKASIRLWTDRAIERVRRWANKK